jgi:Kef-type K+ transport system membrane component KefB
MDLLFFELGSILALATILGLICYRLKQPLFFAYLITGMVVANISKGLLTQPDTLRFLGELGIAFLLFLVGLELSISEIKRLGKTAGLTTLGQIGIVGITSYSAALLLGFSPMVSLYIALALPLTSTIIAVKWLNDQNTVFSLHGRLGLGILLVQDLVAVAAIILLSSLGKSTGQFNLIDTALIITKGATLLVGSYVLSRYIVPKFFYWLASSAELLFLGSIGWCVFLAAVAQAAGFSLEIGAFLAGITLSASSYRHQIVASIKPLRDFFIALFFIVIGLQLSLKSLTSSIVPIVIFSLIVLVLNQLSVAFFLGRFGFKRHTIFFTSQLFGQIGEFSLLVASLGLSQGVLSPSVISLITSVVLVTILAQSYVLKNQQIIYRWLRPLFHAFEQAKTRSGQVKVKNLHDHVVVLGASQLSEDILRMLHKLSVPLVVVEYNPQRIVDLDSHRYPTIFGDATDESVLDEAGIGRARLIVSSIDQHTANLHLLHLHQILAPSVPLVLTAANVDEALTYYRLGAAYVILPFLLGNTAIAQMVKDHWQNLDGLSEAKLQHLQHLAARGYH